MKKLLCPALFTLGFLSSNVALPQSSEPSTTPQWIIPYTVDPDWTPEHLPHGKAMRLLKEAAEKWTPCGAHLTYSGRSQLQYNLPEGKAQGDAGPQVGFTNSLNQYDPFALGVTLREMLPHGQIIGWRILILDSYTLNSDIFLAVASHEFGHALGLDHNDDPNSIMRTATTGRTTTPSSKDIEACKRVLASWKPESAKVLGATLLPPDL